MPIEIIDKMESSAWGALLVKDTTDNCLYVAKFLKGNCPNPNGRIRSDSDLRWRNQLLSEELKKLCGLKVLKSKDSFMDTGEPVWLLEYVNTIPLENLDLSKISNNHLIHLRNQLIRMMIFDFWTGNKIRHRLNLIYDGKDIIPIDEEDNFKFSTKDSPVGPRRKLRYYWFLIDDSSIESDIKRIVNDFEKIDDEVIFSLVDKYFDDLVHREKLKNNLMFRKEKLLDLIQIIKSDKEQYKERYFTKKGVDKNE